MHLKTRLAVGVTATAAAVGALLVPATSAFAAPSLTATPSSSLFEQAVTQVTGSGLPPSAGLDLIECNLQTALAIGLDDPNVVFEACAVSTVTPATTDADGNLPATPFTVTTGQLGSDPSSVCDYSTNGQCVVAAGDPNTFQLFAYTGIAFSQVVATPYLNLHNGDNVDVTGAGLPASTNVIVVECNVANGQDQTACDTNGINFGQTDADGNLPAVAMTAKTGQVGSNPDAVCDSQSAVGDCVFAVADATTQAPLGFAVFTVAAPPHVTTSLSIASNKGNVDPHQKFTIKGRDTAGNAGVNGVKVTLQSRTNKNADWSKVDSTTTKTNSKGKDGSYKFGGLTENKTKYYRVKSAALSTADAIYDADTSGVVKVKYNG
jgi:hypothetical protein